MIEARSFFIAPCIAALMMSGCNNSVERKAGDQSFSSAAGVDGVSTFDVAPAERIALQQRARAGDGKAAYRLARFYGMAGGESGRAGDPRNSLEEEKWLQLSAKAGFEPGKHSLAVKIGRKDCSGARQMMTEIAETGSDPELRENARYWLKDETLCK
jgi:TPR repeat protein